MVQYIRKRPFSNLSSVTRQRSVHLSLRSHVNSLGIANANIHKAFSREPFSSQLQEARLPPKHHPQPGVLLTQKMMQEGLVNPVGDSMGQLAELTFF